MDLQEILVDMEERFWTDGEAFGRMLEDVARISGGLPFAAGEAPLLPFAPRPSTDPPLPYHAFLYLRHVLGPDAPRSWRLLPALDLVVRDPHRRWERSVRRVPLEELSRVDPATVAGIFGSRLEAAPPDRFRSGAAVGRLRKRLQGHLPVSVLQSEVRSEVDTPENRFVLRFLEDARRVVAEVGRAAEARSDAFGRRISHEAEECGTLLDRVRRAPLWREVGPLDHLPISSTVLRSRRGYREVLGHWIRLRRSADLPLSQEGIRALVEAKDIAVLYEVWCFFRVVETAKEILGPPRSAGRLASSLWQMDVDREFAVDWEGLRLVYNGAFRQRGSGLRYAYSSPMIPDIVVEDRRKAARVVHVLDAKFRVQRSERDDAEILRYKSADLHKMHAYRDAIPAVRSATVLYPGEVSRFFPLSVTGGEGSSPDGVGAVALDPEGASGPLRARLRSVLS